MQRGNRGIRQCNLPLGTCHFSTVSFGTLLSVEVILPTETRVSTPHVSPAQSDFLDCSEVSFQNYSVLSQDELSVEDLASQQGTSAPVAVDFSLFLKSWLQ